MPLWPASALSLLTLLPLLSMRRFSFLLALLCFAPIASASLWVEGRASRIGDGDTLTLQLNKTERSPEAKRTQKTAPQGKLKLRLIAIDAPESCQAWGREAKAALQRKLQGQRLRAELLHRDQYGRYLARLYLPSKTQHAAPEDINAWLVAQGHAWDYEFVSGKPGRYAALQEQAQAAGRGLWGNTKNHAAPMQPRQFRRQHGSCFHNYPKNTVKK